MTALHHIEVVIPARDEQDHIGACLASVLRSTQRLRREYPAISVSVTVVLDRCSDRTDEVVAEFGARAVTSEYGCVGSARRIGAAEAIDRMRERDVDCRALWLANTDADSVVGDTWLTTQARLAESGADAVIGTVTPDDLTPRVDRLWRERHRLAEGHDHVHGANLGLRASTYLAAGGFTDTTVGEDRDLVQRVKAVTCRWIATHRTNVTTSARTHSRVDGGFASYVTALAAEDSTCA